MKIPAIKKLVEAYEVTTLQNAEATLLEGEPLGIEVEGSDEGEQLTHIMAAIWVKQQMESNNIEFMEALRAYTKRVRDSIS
jgi:hypothetical protein